MLVSTYFCEDEGKSAKFSTNFKNSLALLASVGASLTPLFGLDSKLCFGSTLGIDPVFNFAAMLGLGAMSGLATGRTQAVVTKLKQTMVHTVNFLILKIMFQSKCWPSLQAYGLQANVKQNVHQLLRAAN